MRPWHHAEGVAELGEELGQLWAEAGADLRERRADRVVEHRAFERTQQVLAEGQGQHFVGREGHVAELESVEEAIERLAIAFLARDGKARVHERIEIAVDRAPHAAEIVGELVEAHARPALREALDELPLACELVTPQVRRSPARRTHRCACRSGSSPPP